MGTSTHKPPEKDGEEMSVLATASMAVTLFAAGIGVVVLLVYSF
jgi:hypothetical protein